MELQYQYRITYSPEQVYDRKDLLCAEISQDDFNKIMIGVANGLEIAEIAGIGNAIQLMTENALFVDRWTNIDGSRRRTALKKKRQVEKIEFFLPEWEVKRIRKMKNPEEMFSRPEEHMTIYRSDGTSVLISSQNGKVKITDSKPNGMCHILEADYFISRIL